MREREIEALYRSRFDRQRDAVDRLDRLYTQTALGRDSDVRAWFIAVAAPRVPKPRAGRMTRDEAADAFESGGRRALEFARRDRGLHPLEAVDRRSPRVGLRCWVAPNTASGEARFKEAWASVGDAGEVTLANALGGHRYSSAEHRPGGHVETRSLECAVADFAGLLHAMVDRGNADAYDLRWGIEYTPGPLTMVTGSPSDHFRSELEVHFVSVRATVLGDVAPGEFHRQVYELALDCVNQGGVSRTEAIEPPPGQEF